ncbi:MAG: DUF2157 domain-containing protein [Gammaproteobacteria bacterium]|nr:DUF2157 domain-containing protein [Gammaproteobacteria bacterium]MYC99534.1 DUF2157 domain-containing protein [Gammaproteobacteria bacterium]
MSRSDMESALERWQEAGLISGELAERLREEHEHSQRRGRRRFLQYAVAGMAGILLVIAAVTFFAWSWPELGPGARTGVIAGTGIAIMLLGMRLEAARRYVPVTYALQTSGLFLLLTAYVYSMEAWDNTTPGGVVVGLLALATPVATIPVFVRRNPVMPAVGTALGYGFLAAFLFRAFDLDTDNIIWILDGALAAALVVLALLLRAGHAQSVSRRTLYAFTVSLYVGYPMAGLTVAGPFELGAETLLALDAWLLLVTALALWGIHRAPAMLRSARYSLHLAASVLIAIPLGFGTALEVYDLPPLGAAAVVAGAGACGLWYGLRSAARPLVLCSCATIVCAAWYLGVDAGDRLGSVLALAFTAALFFWVAIRLGRGKEA